MSEAVRNALAARRAAAKASASTPHVGKDSSFIQSFGTPKTKNEVGSQQDSGASPEATLISQRSEESLLFRSCWNGRLNLSSRDPASKVISPLIFTLLEPDAPSWYEDESEKCGERRAWYERQDLESLAIANGEVEEVDERIAEFSTIVRLDLHNNRITTLPSAFFQLANLTTLKLSRNSFTSIPSSLFALDSLLELDLSYNKLDSLWSDEQVRLARMQRSEWDKENVEQDSVAFPSFLSRSESPTKRQRPPPPVGTEVFQPMRSLRHLSLAHNRLGNAALGLPVREATVKTASCTWPPNLVELDLSDNFLRGPVPLTYFGNLKDLKRLSLGGNAILDEVFTTEECDSEASVSMPFGRRTLFRSLEAIDLQRCEIDDLSKLETVFGSAKTIFERTPEAPMPSTAAEVSSPLPASDVDARQFVRISSIQALLPSQRPGRVLGVVLEGNPLREETFRRRGGTLGPTESGSSSSIPVQQHQASEARAEHLKNSSSPVSSSTARLRRGDGVNRTGLSDWDGTSTLPPRRNAVRNQGELLHSAPVTAGAAIDLGIGSTALPTTGTVGSGGGSTLANAKLTKRQSEALGRVPCKFFRSANGCSAGDACPFAHITATTGSNANGAAGGAAAQGAGKAVCDYFLKGNCRYGAKCLLAHIREGEPPSMDRKNKRAAQLGQKAVPVGQSPTAHFLQHQPYQQQEQQSSQPRSNILMTQQHHQVPRVQASLFTPQLGHMYPQSLTTGIPLTHTHQENEWLQPVPQARTDDFAFGLPDDLQPHSSLPRPAPPSDIFARDHAAAMAFVGSPPSSGAFGSSPFGNGNSVFFSGSQDNSSSAVGGPSLQSSSYTLGMTDDRRGTNGSNDGGSKGNPFNPSLTSRRDHWADGGLSDDGEHNEEDFLPSSLSDLLTPAELERRRKNANVDFRQGRSTQLAQSLPKVEGGSSASLLSRLAVSSSRGNMWADGSTGYSSSHGSHSLVPLTTAGGSAASGARTSGLLWSSSTSPSDLGSAFGRNPTGGLHAPGQSLPRGLASGLSRLHLTTPERHEGVGSASLLPMRQSGPTEVRQSLQSSSLLGEKAQNSTTHLHPFNGTNANTTFMNSAASAIVDDHGLGPTAPSSVLPHRAPGGFHSRFASSLAGSIESIYKQGEKMLDNTSDEAHNQHQRLTDGSPLTKEMGIEIPSSNPNTAKVTSPLKAGSPSSHVISGSGRTWTTGEASLGRAVTYAEASFGAIGGDTPSLSRNAGMDDREGEGEEVGVFDFE